jgi:DNA-directed RNA polymerase subunit RPC12/RpoP
MRYNAREPGTGGTGETRATVMCPYCGSTNTELFSLFGQQLLTVQYYCNSCHTPFERVKDDDVLNDYATRKEGKL